MKSYIEKRILLGFLLLLAGVVLMLKYYNIVPWDLPGWVISWKSLLILLGIVFLITDKDKTSGIVLFIIGFVFVAGDILDMGFWETVRLAAPLVLITAGLALLLRRQSYSVKSFNIPEGDNPNDYINEMNVFGGNEKKIKSQNFKGGQLTAIFGGSDLDMRLASLATGVNAVDLFCLFGGVSIKVPEDWEVRVEVSAVFGGFSDDRRLEKKDIVENPDKVLYIKGLVIFGGGEIK